MLSPGARAELRRIGGILLAMAGVGAGFIVAIELGYRINAQVAPAVISRSFPGAAVVLSAVLVIAGWSILHPSDGGRWGDRTPDLFWARKRRWARESRLLTKETQRRLVRLEADPATRKYAAMIRKGQGWSDEQIAYDRDRSMLVTCAHLQPIERAMRDEGIGVRRNWGPAVDADCLIDETALTARFSMQLPLFYTDDVPGDRPYDPMSAMVACREHGAGIHVVHPDDAKPQTPRFPRRN